MVVMVVMVVMGVRVTIMTQHSQGKMQQVVVHSHHQEA
jgi:hypothetical protein